MLKKIDKFHSLMFSSNNLKRFETSILFLAVLGFIIHLALIYINRNYEVNILNGIDNLLENPISALYTPFSFILIYEVFLLIFYLPRSFTTSIAKEYEIISLIMIRKVFEDIPNLNINTGIFNQESLVLLYNLLGILVIYYLIFLFKKTRKNIPKRKTTTDISRFIGYKKAMSIILVPVLVILCVSNLFNWSKAVFIYQNFSENVNTIFFVDFFTILILVDVFILLISFGYTERYAQIIRNTGFIISTILLRLSFGVKDLSSIVLLVSGVIFGLIILKIYQLTETNISLQ
tara:strand:+ start:608 stop:1477 length:870 start_codon:yes stop_codon:yes gene_type:complete